MNADVFCVDCNVIVELNVFSREHKKHEMKVLTELLEDRKKAFLNFVESRNSDNNIYAKLLDENKKKWMRVIDQATEIKGIHIEQCNKLICQIELNKAAGCELIDNQLSKMGKNFNEFKNKFANSEREKLWTLERIVKNYNMESRESLNMLLVEMAGGAPVFNAELGLTFVPANQNVIYNKFLPAIVPTEKTLLKSLSQIALEKNNKTKVPLLGTPTDPPVSQPPQSTPTTKGNTKEPSKAKALKYDEVSYTMICNINPYLITQDCCYLYVLYNKQKMIHLYSRSSQKFLKKLCTDSEPCRLLSIADKIYYTDNQKTNIFIIDHAGNVDQIYRNSIPKFLSKDKSKNLIISGDKNAVCYNPATKKCTTIAGTSNIGRVLRYWCLDACEIALVNKKDENILLKIQNGNVVSSYDLRLDLMKGEYLMDVNNEGMISILHKHQNVLTVLDNNFVIIIYVHIRRLQNETINNIIFEDFNNVSLMYVSNGVSKVLKFSLSDN